MMIGGYNEIDGAQLYVVEPSGTSFGYYGCAVGKGKQAARAEIEKMKTADMTCAELVKEAVGIRFPLLSASLDYFSLYFCPDHSCTVGIEYCESIVACNLTGQDYLRRPRRD
jgi:hypothetical protein